MKSRRIRIGVVGLGRIGWSFHCQTLARHRDFELVAVADTDPARRREAEETFGCAAFARYEQMLERADLEAVVIASPTHLHKDMALSALRRGLHVYLEKPMAATYADAQAIVRAARRRGRVLSVYQPHRAAAYFRQVLQIIRSGRIGTVYHFRRGGFRYVRRDDWQSLRRFGGGMLNNYGAHSLDQALQVTGYDVRRVFCQLRRVASLGDAEDVVKVVYETRKGVLGEVDINQASAISPYELEVYGTRGAVWLEKDRIHCRSFSPADLKRKRLNRSLASPDRKYPRDDIRFAERTIPVAGKHEVDVYADLARAIRTGSDPLVRPAEPLAVMRLLEQCRQDSRRILVTPI